MDEIVIKVRSRLKENIDEKTLATSQSFFKEKIKFYGVRTANVTKISKESFKLIRDRSKDEILKTCEEFWKSGIIEETWGTASAVV